MFLRQALGKAEDLLDQVQHLYVGETPSNYVLECNARLNVVYGDYSTALEAWDNLLSRPEVVKPPVRRQIVSTHLRRRDGDWGQLTQSRKLGASKDFWKITLRKTEMIRRACESGCGLFGSRLPLLHWMPLLSGLPTGK